MRAASGESNRTGSCGNRDRGQRRQLISAFKEVRRGGSQLFVLT